VLWKKSRTLVAVPHALPFGLPTKLVVGHGENPPVGGGQVVGMLIEAVSESLDVSDRAKVIVNSLA
jgi:hypothetical protein